MEVGCNLPRTETGCTNLELEFGAAFQGSGIVMQSTADTDVNGMTSPRSGTAEFFDKTGGGDIPIG
jgi:hypothetical protein